MRQLRLTFLAALAILIPAVACSPQGSPSNGLVLSPVTQQPAQTLPPTNNDTTAAQTLQALTIAHPPMTVGSIDRYFDGALLDAVPNNGSFLMGGVGPDNPQHQVTVSDFWIYSTEVSNQMYAWCMNLGKCTAPDKKDNPTFQDPQYPNYPVVGVNWQQASDYCGFAHGRLPTEAEWEKAASWDASAKQPRIYPWGNLDPSCDLLNFKNCVNKVTSVVQYGQGRSFYGAYNMEGNVFEWVGDWYQPRYYTAAPANDPMGPDTGTMRVFRSSAFNSDAVYAAPVWRFSAQPSVHRNNLGFRCVVKDPAYFAPFCTAPVFYGVDPAGATANSKPCPDPTIIHSESCGADKSQLQFVTVETSGSTAVTVTGMDACDPHNNDVGVRHQCAPGITIQVNASCAAVPGGSPACPPNFTQDPKNPKQCISPGGPGACPAGFEYDSKLQCCSAVQGSGASVPLCGVGQHFFSGACVNDFGGPQQPASLTYTTLGATCVLPTVSSNSTATIIPVPTGTSVPATLAPTNTLVPPADTATSIVPAPTDTSEPPTPVPADTNTPAPQGSTCNLQPQDCPLFGVNQRLCICKLLP